MNPIQFFELASKQADWLSRRKEVIAGNIANANTPRYRAKDITPFEAVLNDQDMQTARTNAMHFSNSGLSGNDGDQNRGEPAVVDAEVAQEVGVQESGNTVSLENELEKSGLVSFQYTLNTSLVSSFHRMMMDVVKK